MSSAVLSIYSSLAAMSVTVGGTTPAVYSLAALKTSVASADLPCRLLLPVNGRAEAESFGFIAMGKLAKVVWRISDLLLWRPVAQGIGLADVAETLVGYAGAYAEALRSQRAMAQQAVITAAALRPGVIEWPMGSGAQYHGVDCTLTVEEVISAS